MNSKEILSRYEGCCMVYKPKWHWEHALSRWFLTRTSSHAGPGREHMKNRAMKEVSDMRGPTVWRCDLARVPTTWPHQLSGRFLGIITGWEPSVCKSDRLHVDILRFSGYIPWIPLKWSIILMQYLTSTGYFSDSTGSSVTNCRFSRIIGPHIWHFRNNCLVAYLRRYK